MTDTTDWDKVRKMDSMEKIEFIAAQLQKLVGNYSNFLLGNGIPNKITIRFTIRVS